MRSYVTNDFAARRNQSGFSLIEVLTALGLGGVVIAGLLVLFTNVSETWRLDFAIARIQDNARFAYRLVEWDIRSAGYQSCIDNNRVISNVIANNAPTTTVTADALQGYEVGNTLWTPAIDPAITSLVGVAKVGSDVLTVHHTTEERQLLSVTMSSVTDDIRVTDNPLNLQVDDLVLISDCSEADLFQVSSLNDSGNPVVIGHGGATNTSASLTKAYAAGSNISRYTANTYYVADTGNQNAAGNPVFSLFQQDVYGERTEIIEGVNSMQILYGEYLGPDNIRYVTADAAGLDMSRVRTIRLGLLMQSTTDARSADDNTVYNLPGDTVSPAGTPLATQTYIVDSTLKQVFTTTVTLRNRL